MAPKTELLRPEDFAAVVPGKVYRSAYPLPKNFPFFESLKLRSVICLDPKPYWNNNLDFLESENIKLIHIGISHGQTSEHTMEIAEKAINEALKEVVDERNHPVLIHCLDGKRRTGCLVGCFRKFQNWGLPAILKEYKQFAGEMSREIDLAFLKIYDVSRLKRQPSPRVAPDCTCCADKLTNATKGLPRIKSRLDTVEKDFNEIWEELDKMHTQVDRIEGMLEALLSMKLGPPDAVRSPNSTALATIQLTLKEYLELKANRLCIKCRQPYVPRHKCPCQSLQVTIAG